jgi:hypothetical protein
MNRLIIAFGCLFFMTYSAYSQTADSSRHDPETKNVLSLSIGASIPVGAFASTKPSDNSSGNAGTGEAINLSFTHKLHNGFGLTVQLLGQRNPLNTGGLGRQLDGTGYWFYRSYRYYPNWTVDKASWYTGSLLVGITKKISLAPNSRFSVAGRALIGAAHVQSPAINANSKSDTSYAILTQNSGSAFSFSYLAGAGLQYHLHKHISLLFGADYFGTTPVSFKNTAKVFTATIGGLAVPGVYSFSNILQPMWSESSTHTIKQSLSAINLHLGASLTL